MPNAWLLLTYGAERQYGGNTGYADDPSTCYRYDSLVQNSRRLGEGDLVVLRDRTAMVGVAVIEEIVSRPGTKRLRRCPQCSTTKFARRSSRRPQFRCNRGHEFEQPVEDETECETFEARLGSSFQSAPGGIPLGDLRAACHNYTDQLSMQELDPERIRRELDHAGIHVATQFWRVLGVPYRAADEAGTVAERDPFEVDPHLVERGTRGHAMTQNALAAFLRANGLEPRSPRSEEPDFDLAWIDGAAAFVAEVKSITDDNEQRQLRLGLGQVLHYRFRLAPAHSAVIPVLAVEREPRDELWREMCRELGVLLVWTGHFDDLRSSARS